MNMNQKTPIRNISPTERLEGVLFRIPQQDLVENGPVMQGSLRAGDELGQIKASAWTKTSDGGKKYISLTLEVSREIKYYGAIFKNENPSSEKSPSHFGSLNLTKEKNGAQLRLSGWKRTTQDGKEFLSLVIEPAQPQRADYDDSVPAKAPAKRNPVYDDIPL
jgi:uncharacterized protein (DUF736 family)